MKINNIKAFDDESYLQCMQHYYATEIFSENSILDLTLVLLNKLRCHTPF